MAHLPLILSPTGGKLSKRNADKMGIPVSVKDYRAAGYEPEALVNFLAFLGWNPGDERELFSLDELVDAFSLDAHEPQRRAVRPRQAAVVQRPVPPRELRRGPRRRGSAPPRARAG